MSRNTFGIALAGGGPLGAIYEIGALVALDEALGGIDLTACDVYVGVSSGAFLAAGLANGLKPRTMYEMFIETEGAEDPFEPETLLRPAIGEYGRRLAGLPGLILSATRSYLEAPYSRGFFESFQRIARAMPTGIFDNSRIGHYLRRLFDAPARTNDFRQLRHKLFLVATDLDTGTPVPFGAPGWDDVPISLAVQASSALPGLFPPVEIGGRHYVDGALVKTLHASVALKEGAKLLLCINPLVPFDAKIAPKQRRGKPISLIEGGLPAVLAQTFRSIIYSRMQVGMSRYESEFPDADVVLFEPSPGDTELFFANVFSYVDRERLSEHAYQRTRAELLRRYDELAPIFHRHGISIRRNVLTDTQRTLSGNVERAIGRLGGRLTRVTAQLNRILRRLDDVLQSRDARDAAAIARGSRRRLG
ncbi:MAG: patatin-like phospholipase family protein [Rhodomicrobiaceae bacterium]